MDQELRGAVEELRRQLETSAAETRRHTEATAAENRRHFDVVAEALRRDGRLVAEGVTGLSQRVDRLEANLREEILRSHRAQRVTELGQWHEQLEGRLHRLETAR